MSQFTVAMLLGSLRADSINLRLAKSVERYAPDGLTFRWLQMDDMPFYNADLEADRPAPVRRFAKEIQATDAACIVSPEYNRSVPALIKNAVDWGSRPPAANVWRDRVIAMTGASPGAIGTALAQQHLRQMLAIQGAIVMPGETYITFKTPDMIAADGEIADASVRDFITAFAARFARLVERMR
jgi:chromate reductase